MSAFFFVLWAIQSIPSQCQSDKPILNIYSLSTITTGTTGASITAAQRLAVDTVNSDDIILPNYHLQLTPIDVEGSRTTTLLKALDITINDQDSNPNITNIPIIQSTVRHQIISHLLPNSAFGQHPSHRFGPFVLEVQLDLDRGHPRQ